MRNRIICTCLLFFLALVVGSFAQGYDPPPQANTAVKFETPPRHPATIFQAIPTGIFQAKINEVPPCYDDDETCLDTCVDVYSAYSPPDQAAQPFNYLTILPAPENLRLSATPLQYTIRPRERRQPGQNYFYCVSDLSATINSDRTRHRAPVPLRC